MLTAFYSLGRPISAVPAAIATATSLATFASRAGLDHRGDQEAKDSDGDERLHVVVKALTCSGKLRSHFRSSLRFIGYSNCAFKRLSHHAECSPKIVANLRRIRTCKVRAKKVGWIESKRNFYGIRKLQSAGHVIRAHQQFPRA